MRIKRELLSSISVDCTYTIPLYIYLDSVSLKIEINQKTAFSQILQISLQWRHLTVSLFFDSLIILFKKEIKKIR